MYVVFINPIETKHENVSTSPGMNRNQQYLVGRVGVEPTTFSLKGNYSANWVTDPCFGSRDRIRTYNLPGNSRVQDRFASLERSGLICPGLCVYYSTLIGLCQLILLSPHVHMNLTHLSMCGERLFQLSNPWGLYSPVPRYMHNYSARLWHFQAINRDYFKLLTYKWLERRPVGRWAGGPPGDRTQLWHIMSVLLSPDSSKPGKFID